MTTKRTHRIGSIPRDGIGNEVIPVKDGNSRADARTGITSFIRGSSKRLITSSGLEMMLSPALLL